MLMGFRETIQAGHPRAAQPRVGRSRQCPSVSRFCSRTQQAGLLLGSLSLGQAPFYFGPLPFGKQGKGWVRGVTPACHD